MDDLPRHLPWHLSETPLTGTAPAVLHSSRGLSRAEVISSLHVGNFCYSRVLSSVMGSSRTHQMQPTSALPLRKAKRENHAYSS